MFFVVVAGGEVAGLYRMEADALIRARELDGGCVVPLRVNEARCVGGDRPVEWSPECDARVAVEHPSTSCASLSSPMSAAARRRASGALSRRSVRSTRAGV